MALANVDGLEIAYDVIGDGGRPWALTPGGRFSKETPGLRELAEAIAAEGYQVVIWDRPNTGESSVCFDGDNESAMQADALGGLLRQLGLSGAVIAGGSGGSRVSLLTATRHRDLAAGLAMWWISGGVFGLMSLAVHYCGPSVTAAWHGGMEAVAELPEWQDVLNANPGNRARLLAQDPKQFVKTLESWMLVYCPDDDNELVPGVPNADVRSLEIPSLVFRSGESDLHHTRHTSEVLASLLPQSRQVEPPWPDTEWNDRHTVPGAPLFVRWPLLAPQLLSWAKESNLTP
jgi:pimeloyl-ACP methyl ester carboxylesterase